MPSNNKSNKTYGRLPATTNTRKPLATVNSAPVLSSISAKTGKSGKNSRTTAPVNRTDDNNDSLEDFEVTKKASSITDKKKMASVFRNSDDDDGGDAAKEEQDTFSPVVMKVTKNRGEDDVFDRLFEAGPVRKARVSDNSALGYNCSSTPPSSYLSAESSKNLLFASFDQSIPLPRKPLHSATASKGKLKEKAQTLLIPQGKGRLFSDETLNFVAKGLEKLQVSNEEKENSDVSDDIFKSPEQSSLEESKASENSPFVGMQATSTPKLVSATLPGGNTPTIIVPQAEVEKESLKSPRRLSLFLPPKPLLLQPPASELIPRKGGKHWRRSIRLSNAVVDNRRATTNATLAVETAESTGGKSRRSGFVVKSWRRQSRQVPAFILDEEDDVLEDEKMTAGVAGAFVDTLAEEVVVEEQEEKEEIQLRISDVDKLLSRCTDTEIRSFENLYTHQRLSQATKIGEGAFGEVFLLPIEDRDEGDEEERDPVVKIVPVGGQALVNEQPQTKLQDMMAEIIISTELSRLASSSVSMEKELTTAAKRSKDGEICDAESVAMATAPGFLNIRQCNLIRGNYPPILLTKWDEYQDAKGSDNVRPDTDLFPVDSMQKFVVLEMSNGGEDLENVILNNASVGLAIFQQVAHALGIAEQAYQFEHRDLHWGNVLVRDTSEKAISYSYESRQFEVETLGKCATIIDFSLSRMRVPRDECDIFNNLAEDPELFSSEGQPEGDYQFDIYRKMKAHTGNEWKGFYPKTNVMWLHYLLDKLINQVYYRNKKSKVHRSALSKMRTLHNDFLTQFHSAYDFICTTVKDT